MGSSRRRLLREREPGEPRRPERVLASGELEGGRHRHHRPRQRLGPHLGLDRPRPARRGPGPPPSRASRTRARRRRGRRAPAPAPSRTSWSRRSASRAGARGSAPRGRPAPPTTPPAPTSATTDARSGLVIVPSSALLPDRQHRDGGVGVALQQRERVHDRHRRVRRPEVDPHVVAGLLEPALDLPARAARQSRREARRAVGCARGHRPERQLVSGACLSRHLAPSRGSGFERERGRSARGSDDRSPGLSSRSRVSRTSLPQQVRLRP